MTSPSSRILIVSKPVAPPFTDGSICLVRDLASALVNVSATVLTTRDAPAVSTRVAHARIYVGRGGYAPALRDNARVLAHLLAGPRYALWHFVFAPNPLSSHAASLARAVRKIPVVQTVASRPRSFAGSSGLLFGDRIVVLSRHTADRLTAHGCPASKIRVVPPPVHDVERSAQEASRARAWVHVPPHVPMFVYAGDLEFSRGARVFADAIPRIRQVAPETFFVFACRAKTPKSRDAQTQIQRTLSKHADHVRFSGEVPDLPALMASAIAAPFPVDDLYGKVDFPYAVLESALLRIPLIVARATPLEDIEGACVIESSDAEALAQESIRLLRDAKLRNSMGETQRSYVLRTNDPRRVAEQYEAVYSELTGS